jgi:hypothetical protein
LSNSSTLRDLAEHLRKQAPIADVPVVNEPMPEYASVIVDALDNALVMIGRSGAEVFHGAMKRMYGFDETDIAMRPGEYMSALKATLDSSSDMIEGYILREVQKKRGIAAGSVEEAVNMLKQAEKVSSSGKP